tara:strand:+ start:2437 stop:3450 length:1014 start_codon:yes stop_codon:yes gene_type:complete
MTVKLAINGFGRIGRNIVRALYESDYITKDFQIVAINDVGKTEVNTHLLKYDTVHGQFIKDVELSGDYLNIDETSIKMISTKDPKELPWKELGVDLVLECTGAFNSRDKAQLHIDAGAKKVLISAPAGSDVDATIVYGVNHSILKDKDIIVSNASCTTNCLAPVVKVLHENFGVEYGLMNTVHAYTNDQNLTDSNHTDFRRARAATQSIIPANTGAAAAIGLVLPELDGKLDGFAVRVPVINVSLVDFTFISKKVSNIDEVNAAMYTASKGELKNILGYNSKPLVSTDFNHTKESSIFDATQTKIKGNLIKVLSWYDNEWGFSNRMIDTARVMMGLE